jgi:hypothetical protein
MCGRMLRRDPRILAVFAASALFTAGFVYALGLLR